MTTIGSAIADVVGAVSGGTSDQKPTDLDKLRTRVESRRSNEATDQPADQRLSLATAPDVVKIGKLQTGTVVFAHDDVARMHAVLERTATGWRLIDLGTRVGCTVNGTAVDKHAPVTSGDVLGFGLCTLTLEP